MVAGLVHVHDARFGRMQHEAGLLRLRAHVGQRAFGVRLGFADDHDVVGVADHLPAFARHQLGEVVQGDVRQQGADDAAWWGARLGLRESFIFYDPGLQELFE